MANELNTQNKSPELASGAEIWLKNLEALYRTNARLAQAIDDLPPDDQLTLEDARNGEPTIKVSLENGREIYLHSKYDPKSEAAKFVDNLDLEKNFVFVIAGLGLGYQIRELFDRASSQTYVVIFEPTLALIRQALWLTDLSQEIDKGRLIILNENDKGILHDKLSTLASIMILGTSLQRLSYTQQWHGDFHTQMLTTFADFMAYNRVAYVTMLGNSQTTQTNVANNLADYVCNPSIDSLKGKFENYPAIVVAAGPSTAKNIELLKDAKGKAVIICVQTMYKPLRKLGVEPDFVTSLDYSQISGRFFEGIEDFGQSQLIVEAKAHNIVLDLYKGQKRLFKNEFADMCLGPMAEKRDSLKAGSTVAHLSFYFAEYLGVKTIIMVGQDLGFTDNMYYAPGNPIHDVWDVELNRFYSIEMKEWERIVRGRHTLRKVHDINDREIFTDEQMFTYLQQFERDFAQTRANVIDATEGGVRKQNTTIMTLSQALEKYVDKPIPEELFERPTKEANRNQYDGETLIALTKQLENRIEEANKFKSLCRQTQSLLSELKQQLDNPREFNRLIVKIDEIRVRANNHSEMQKMVCNVSTIAELRRFMHDRHLDVDKTKGKAKAENQLSRDADYMKTLITGTDQLLELLEKAIDRVKSKQKETDERN